MTPQQLQARTTSFAVQVVRLTRELSRTEEARVIARQLLRAGTGVGANCRAVCRARSDAEFIAKLGIVLEECDETAYWLELLAAAGVCTPAAIRPAHGEADELLRIMVASRDTVRRRRRK